MPTRKPQPPPKADDPEQSRRFIDMAHEVETDETLGAMDRAFNKVIPPRSAPNPSAHRSPPRAKKAEEP